MSEGSITGLPVRRKRSTSKAKELMRRARAAGRSETIKTSLVLRLDHYERLVALAERYHKPMAEIIRECLQDGLRKHEDFRSPFDVEMNQSVIDRLTGENGFVADQEEDTHEEQVAALESQRELLAGFIPSSSKVIMAPSDDPMFDPATTGT